MAEIENKPTYDEAFWEQLWSKTLREQGDKVAQRPPHANMVNVASSLTPGRALDPGVVTARRRCGSRRTVGR